MCWICWHMCALLICCFKSICISGKFSLIFIFRYLFWFSVWVTLNVCLLDIHLCIFLVYCFLFKPLNTFHFCVFNVSYIFCSVSSVLLFVSSFLLSFHLFFSFFLGSLSSCLPSSCCLDSSSLNSYT